MELQYFTLDAIIYKLLNLAYMNEYERELEQLITDTLLPVYIDYLAKSNQMFRLREVNARLLSATKKRKKIPALLKDYGNI